MATSLADILAQARSGALETAWATFLSSGYAEATRDPAALTLKGRLLKDRARRQTGPARSRLYAEAGAAYAAAAALEPATYPLINAASLAFLAGDPDKARALAGDVLALIASGAHEPETAYWLAATRAEALLLLDRRREAEDALAEAMTRAPDAWEDHAATLRQFAAILAAAGTDAAWLDPYRPPPSLHFSGMMGLGGDDRSARRTIADALAAERPGFAYGALAAGADIVIAEVLREMGVRLHVVLPCPVAAFAATSVAPFGAAWMPRFEALLADAETVEALGEAESPLPAAIRLADEVAMGMALANARLLESSALALRVDDGDAEDSAFDPWRAAGHRLIALRMRRAVAAPVQAATETLDVGALLGIVGAEPPPASAPAREPVWRIRLRQGTVYAYSSPVAAAAAGLALAARAGGHRLALDYTLFARAHGDAPRLERVLEIAAAARPGGLLASRATALALGLHAPELHSEPIGELRTGTGPVEVAGLYPAAAQPER